ncbi:hypothetical protein GF357_00565 [Candidatus Dojkabacteria bacterium]|nr:hypothetical protein [Candidatus Dojkabacteria bacterium]
MKEKESRKQKKDSNPKNKDSEKLDLKKRFRLLTKRQKKIIAYLLAVVWSILGIAIVFIIGKSTTANTFKSDLPIVIIDTGGHKLNNEKPTQVNARIIFNVAGNPNYLNSLASHFNGGVGMRLRGDRTKELQDVTTYHRYTFETRHSNGEDMNFPLFGFPEESDWMIEGPITDETALANMLALELSSQLGYYAPRTQFVEVFFSDDKNTKAKDNYVGVFMFSEKVKKDKERVDIEDLASGNDPEDDLSGGHLLELTSMGEIKEKDAWFETDKGTKVINAYPKVTKLTEPQQQWIREYVNDFEKLLYRHQLDNKTTGHYTDFIDQQSLIDYIIINDLFKNTDAFYENTFVTKDKGEKMMMGPIWDVVRPDSIDYEDEYSSQGFYVITGRWTEPLFNDEEFAKAYVARWRELRESKLNDENIRFILDAYSNELGFSNSSADSAAIIESLRSWLLRRSVWLDENIDWLVDKGDPRDLPVVVIDSRGEKISKSGGKEIADVWIYNNDGTIPHYNNLSSFINHATLEYSGVLGISKRGQSSMAFDKLNFTIEFRDTDNEELQKDVQILDFPEDADFVLHGPWSDKSLMRNALVYKLWEEMGYYAPRTQFIELYVNGNDSKNSDPEPTTLDDSDYRGVYVLTEKIKRGQRRVDIAKNSSTSLEDPDISGGFILERSTEGKKNPDDTFFYTESAGHNLFILSYPKNDLVNQAQIDWIQDYMTEYEYYVYNDTSHENFATRYDYIDMQSWIDQELIQEFTKNVDGLSVSSFFHKDLNGKIVASPIWDFNITLGNIRSCETCSDPERWFIKGKSMVKPLMKDPVYTDTYIARWHELRKDVLSDKNVDRIIDDYAYQLSEAQERNFERWPVLGVRVNFNNPDAVKDTWEEEVEYMRWWSKTRLNWMDEEIDGLTYLYEE